MIQSPLEMRHLQTLVALADTGSLSKAAERVFVTQSALSHQLKLLESHYGSPCSSAAPSRCASPRPAPACWPWRARCES